MPQPASSLADWLARLETFSVHEIELGLDRVSAVLDRLDLQMPSHVLHVAGTNGKGSSVAYAAALLGRCDLRVGTYTSPHIVSFNERIAVDAEAASDEAIVAAFERVEAHREGTPLTYFEYATLAALAVFEARCVDVAVLEVGMGGRLDAVNAVEPSAGLITNVALDHCDWLGEDVETIAREKAGIMRAGRPIVFAAREVPQAIVQSAARLDADLWLAGRDFDWQPSVESWRWHGRRNSLDDLQRPGLAGAAQIGNAAGVLALMEAAGFDDVLDTRTVNDALSGVTLAGRMQSHRSDRDWLFDVAHNPAAARSLAASLAEAGTRRTVAIVGMLDDKDVEGIVEPLNEHVDKWIAVTAASPRAIPVEELARRVANASNSACLEARSIADAVAEARSLSTESDRILVTGSFYAVGPTLEALGLYSPR